MLGADRTPGGDVLGADRPQTGDPTSIAGAVSGVFGAAGSLMFFGKRRKNRKKENEE